MTDASSLTTCQKVDKLSPLQVQLLSNRCTIPLFEVATLHAMLPLEESEDIRTEFTTWVDRLDEDIQDAAAVFPSAIEVCSLCWGAPL
jgi:hypothetical protein